MSLVSNQPNNLKISYQRSELEKIHFNTGIKILLVGLIPIMLAVGTLLMAHYAGSYVHMLDKKISLSALEMTSEIVITASLFPALFGLAGLGSLKKKELKIIKKARELFEFIPTGTRVGETSIGKLSEEKLLEIGHGLKSGIIYRYKDHDHLVLSTNALTYSNTFLPPPSDDQGPVYTGL